MEYQKHNMGAIGRKLGNSITTAGKVLPGAVNNTSVSGVTALPSGIDAGSMVLLSTQTASSSSSISFTSGIDSTYKEYMFIFTNIHPQTDAVNFTFNLSTDGGSNYNVTKTTTYFRANHNENDVAASLDNRTSERLAQSTVYQKLTLGTNGDADSACSGVLQLFNPSDTTYVKHFIARVSDAYDEPSSNDTFVAGYANTTSAINAIDFKFASGNIDDGTIQMFGVK